MAKKKALTISELIKVLSQFSPDAIVVVPLEMQIGDMTWTTDDRPVINVFEFDEHTIELHIK
jgi:hypothetical protein